MNFVRGEKKKQQRKNFGNRLHLHLTLGSERQKGGKLYVCKLFLSGTAHGPSDGKIEQTPFYALQFNVACFISNVNYCENVMPWFTAIAVGMGKMRPILSSSQISP